MLVPAIMAAALAFAPTGADGAQPAPRTDNLFSDCFLTRTASLEGTSKDKLQTFSKRNANKAFAACQDVKTSWAASLDQQLSCDPRYQDPVARKAEINRIVATDELAVMLLIMRAN